MIFHKNYSNHVNVIITLSKIAAKFPISESIFMEWHRAIVPPCRVKRQLNKKSAGLSGISMIWEFQNLRWFSMKILRPRKI